MSESAASTNPVICTLGDEQRSNQVLEWSEIWRLARTTDRIEGGVAATFDLKLADGIDDLAQRKIGCCGSWLDITTRRLGDTIHFEVTTANPDGIEVIERLAGLAQD